MKRAKIIKGKKPRANDNFDNFADELTLAELIQNAAARGLTSVRHTLFAKFVGDEDKVHDEDDDVDFYQHGKGYVGIGTNSDEEFIVERKGAIRSNPPKGATCACALGSMSLTPKLTHPLSITAMQGNDTRTGEAFTVEVYEDLRSAQIGSAYEQALRPE